MKRILTYPVHADTAGWTILRFLREKHYSRSVVVQLKKTENGILVNNEWAYVNHILKEGEILTIQLVEPGEQGIKPQRAFQENLLVPDSLEALPDRQKICPVNLPVPVAYEDEDLLVVNKPAHMPVHPSMGHDKNTLANAVCYHAMLRNESYPYRCINRLDRDTSGLTVIAKNAYSSCVLYEQMRERNIHRTYYAIAEGRTPEEGTVHAPIARKENTILERTVDFSKGEPAVTHFQTLAYKDGLSFLKLWLDTGRTHQIRVHMSYTGHPLIGDFLYNPGSSRIERQALHAGRLEFTHPVTGQTLVFSAPLPQDMKQFFPDQCF